MKLSLTRKLKVGVATAVVLIGLWSGVFADVFVPRERGNIIFAAEVGIEALKEHDFGPFKKPPTTDSVWASAGQALGVGDGTESNPYIISTAEQLVYIAEQTGTSTGPTYSGVHFLQGADIDLGGKIWRSIGISKSFGGIFNGGNHRITNLTLAIYDRDYIGLFAKTDGATITDVNIVNGYIDPYARTRAALLIGQAKNTVLKNIAVHGLVSGYNEGGQATGHSSYMAGVVAELDNTGLESSADNTLNHLYNYATVRGGSYTGGIVGRMVNADIANSANRGPVFKDVNNASGAGGVIGSAAANGRQLAFTHIVNEEAVSSQNYYHVGGLVGETNGTGNGRVLLKSSLNSGVVTAQAGSFLGGLIGTARYTDIKESDNTANIGKINVDTVVNYVGGLVGDALGVTIENCDNGTSVEAVTVTGRQYVGGLAGRLMGITAVSGSVNYGEIKSDIATSGTVGGIAAYLNSNDAELSGISNHGAVSAQTVGGIIGRVDNTIALLIEGTQNYGCLRAAGNGTAGGLIGYISRSTVTISLSSNGASGGGLLQTDIFGYIAGGAVGYSESGILTVDGFDNYMSFADEEPLTLKNMAGGVVGRIGSEAEFYDVTNHGDININATYVGGIIGYGGGKLLVVKDSENIGDITGARYVGGIIGWGNADLTAVNNEGNIGSSVVASGAVGGIAGYTGKLILKSVNNGSASLSITVGAEDLRVGGLVGYSSGSSDVDISNAYNYAVVSGHYYVGGLVGESGQTLRINESGNSGSVIAKLGGTNAATGSQAGGLVGRHSGKSLTVIKSYNYGAISSEGVSATISYATGGLVGTVSVQQAVVDINESGNKGNVTGRIAGGIIGYWAPNNRKNVAITKVSNEGAVGNADSLYAGGLIAVGENTQSTAVLDKASNEGLITGNTVGGLVGRMGKLYITGSTNEAIGQVSGYAANAMAGGIVGYVYEELGMQDVVNSAAINMAGTVRYAGGLAGYAGGTVTIAKSANTGLISSTSGMVSRNESLRYGSVGGLAGAAFVKNMSISNSYNTGIIDVGTFYAGGLVGAVKNTTADSASYISHSYFEGNVLGGQHTVANTVVGGAVGQSDNGLSLQSVSVEGMLRLAVDTGGIIGRVSLGTSTKAVTIKDVVFAGGILDAGSLTGLTASLYCGAIAGSIVNPPSITIESAYSYIDSATLEVLVSGKTLVKRVFGQAFLNDATGLMEIESVYYPAGLSEGVAPVNGAYHVTGGGELDEVDYTNPDKFGGLGLSTQNVIAGQWIISSVYNQGRPSLRNVFAAELVFESNAADATLGEGGADSITLPVLVGGSVSIDELTVARPVRPLYEFAGWSDSSTGAAITDYGRLFEGIDGASVTLYAVWVPERIYFDFGMQGIEVYKGGELTAERYATRGEDKRIVPHVGAGETFLRWEIYDASAGAFVPYSTLGQNNNIDFSIEEEVNALEDYITLDRFGRKSIRLYQINDGDKLVSLEIKDIEGNKGFGHVVIGGTEYRTDSMLSFAQGTNNVTITLRPNAHYELRSVSINGTTVAEGNGYTVDTDGSYVIALTAEQTKIAFTLAKIEYTVRYEEFDRYTGDVINSTTLNPFVLGGQASIDYAQLSRYRYEGLFVRDLQGNYERYKYEGREGAVVEDDFLTRYSQNGVIYIRAQYVKQFAIEITVNNEGGGGSFAARAIIDGQNVNLSNMEGAILLDGGSNIKLEAIREINSTFKNFEGIDGLEGITVNGSIATFSLSADAVIIVNFDLAYFDIVTKTSDQHNAVITGADNVTVIDNDDAKVAVDGTLALGLKSEVVEGYRFEGWYIESNGNLIPMSEAGITVAAGGMSASGTVTERFVQDYANDGRITVVARYYKLYTVTVASSDSDMGSVEVYLSKGGSEVKQAPQQGVYIFAYGERIVIRAVVSNQEYYELTEFEGLIAGENADGGVLVLDVGADRLLTAGFRSKDFALVNKTNTDQARAKVAFNKTDIKLNDTVILTANVDFGYELRSWVVYDKSGKAYNASELKDNITMQDNTLVLKVDEYWLDNFGLNFESEVMTIMNNVYLALMLVGAIGIPTLIAGIIMYSILNNKKKVAAKQAQERAARMKYAIGADDFIRSLTSDDKK